MYGRVMARQATAAGNGEEATGEKAELALTSQQSEPLDPSELCTTEEALRILRCNKATLYRYIARQEVTQHKTVTRGGIGGEIAVPGRGVMFERAELEALTGKADGADVLREACALLRQSHDHQQKTMKVLIDAAGHFMALTQQSFDRVTARNEYLEKELIRQNGAVTAAERSETEAALRLLEAEGEQERKRALMRAGEAAIPILLAKMTGGASAADAGIAAGVRALAGDPETVAALRKALPPEKVGIVDALLEAAAKPSSAGLTSAQ